MYHFRVYTSRSTECTQFQINITIEITFAEYLCICIVFTDDVVRLSQKNKIYSLVYKMHWTEEYKKAVY